MKDREIPIPLTLIKHRHAIVREKLAMYPIESVLDVGGSSYKRDTKGRLTFSCETAQLIGINLTGDSPHGRQMYLSANIAGDYDRSRCPDVIYNGTSLPFANNSVTAVTAIDVLEHVPYKDRGSFISEMCRVAAMRALLVFPFHSKNNMAFEERLFAHLEMSGIPRRPSFDEHRKLGLVRIADIQAILESFGYHYEISYHSPLDVLIPYHNRQIEILIAYGQGAVDKKTAQRLLLKLQKSTEEVVDHYHEELSPDRAYRVLFNVDTHASL